MIDVKALQEEIKKKDLDEELLAERLYIDITEFYDKMNLGKFDSDEIQTMVDMLELPEPTKIFFAK